MSVDLPKAVESRMDLGTQSHCTESRTVAATLQKMAAVETASAEERERLRATYKQRMQDMDARLKVRLFRC